MCSCGVWNPWVCKLTAVNTGWRKMTLKRLVVDPRKSRFYRFRHASELFQLTQKYMIFYMICSLLEAFVVLIGNMLDVVYAEEIIENLQYINGSLVAAGKLLLGSRVCYAPATTPADLLVNVTSAHVDHVALALTASRESSESAEEEDDHDQGNLSTLDLRQLPALGGFNFTSAELNLTGLAIRSLDPDASTNGSRESSGGGGGVACGETAGDDDDDEVSLYLVPGLAIRRLAAAMGSTLGKMDHHYLMVINSKFHKFGTAVVAWLTVLNIWKAVCHGKRLFHEKMELAEIILTVFSLGVDVMGFFVSWKVYLATNASLMLLLRWLRVCASCINIKQLEHKLIIKAKNQENRKLEASKRRHKHNLKETEKQLNRLMDVLRSHGFQEDAIKLCMGVKVPFTCQEERARTSTWQLLKYLCCEYDIDEGDEDELRELVTHSPISDTKTTLNSDSAHGDTTRNVISDLASLTSGQNVTDKVASFSITELVAPGLNRISCDVISSMIMRDLTGTHVNTAMDVPPSKSTSGLATPRFSHHVLGDNITCVTNELINGTVDVKAPYYVSTLLDQSLDSEVKLLSGVCCLNEPSANAAVSTDVTVPDVIHDVFHEMLAPDINHQR